MHIPPASPLYAASHLSTMAQNTEDKVLKYAMVGATVAFLGVMAYEKFLDLQCKKQSWAGRELERRPSQGHGRGA